MSTLLMKFTPMVGLPPVITAPDEQASITVSTPPPTATITPIILSDGSPVSPSSLVIDGPAANGTASVSGTSLLYTPNAGYAGIDTFTYHAIVSGVNSNIATVTVEMLLNPLARNIQKQHRLLADIYADTTLDCYCRSDVGPIDLTGYQLTAHLHPYNRPQPFGQDYGVGWPGIYVPWHTEFPAEQLEVGHVQFTVDHGTIHQRLGPGMFTVHLVAVDPVSLSRTRVYTALLTIQ